MLICAEDPESSIEFICLQILRHITLFLVIFMALFVYEDVGNSEPLNSGVELDAENN